MKCLYYTIFPEIPGAGCITLPVVSPFFISSSAIDPFLKPYFPFVRPQVFLSQFNVFWYGRIVFLCDRAAFPLGRAFFLCGRSAFRTIVPPFRSAVASSRAVVPPFFAAVPSFFAAVPPFRKAVASFREELLFDFCMAVSSCLQSGFKSK